MCVYFEKPEQPLVEGVDQRSAADGSFNINAGFA